MIDNKVRPFTELKGCPKCGVGDEPPVYPPAPALPIEYAGALPILMGSFTPLRTRYCPGGQEPESPVELDPMATSLQAAMAAMTSIIPEHKRPELAAPRGKINICAGIGQEHLHATCSNCSYEFLMATKDTQVEVSA